MRSSFGKLLATVSLAAVIAGSGLAHAQPRPRPAPTARPGAPAAPTTPRTPAARPKPTSTPTPGKQSETMERGLKLAKRTDTLWQAAEALDLVVDNKSGDDEGNRQLAEFELAAVFYKLRLYQPSYALFSSIASNPYHLKFSSTLNYLFKLARELPEPAEVVERLGQYEDQIGKFDNAEQRADYQELAFLYGKYLSKNNQFEKAAKYFQKVGRDSKFYVKARFFEGKSFVQLYRRGPAIEAFTKVLKAIDDGADVDEAQRMVDLAHLSLARLEYSSAFLKDGRVIEERLDEAEKFWNKVDVASEYWLDALFEESWAYVIKQDYARALGNIHAIQSPYFPDAYYPEAEIIKAYIYLESCQHDNARIVIARFRKTYDPIEKSLQGILDKLKKENETARPSDKDDEGQEGAFFRFLVRVRDGKETLPPAVATVVRAGLSDRELLRHIEYVREIDAERARFKKEAPSSFKTSGAGERVRDALKASRSLAVQNADDLVRKRFESNLEGLSDLVLQSKEMQHDILQAERDELRAKADGQKREAAMLQATKTVEVDDEHVIWPFDGEYWRDELGFYRQKISTCRSQK